MFIFEVIFIFEVTFIFEVSSYSRLYNNLIRPLVSVKVAKPILELFWLGWGVSKHVVIMLSQFN